MTIFSKQQVAPAASTVLANPLDYGDYAGAGFEGMSKDDYAVPFLRVLQTNSPQIEGGTAGIDGAKAGMIFNNVTRELIDGKTGVPFVPVAREHNFVEYVPRDAGGGFVGLRDIGDPLVAALREKQGAFGRLKTDAGTELVETYYVFGLALLSDRRLMSVVGFSSTQIKFYRSWMTYADGLVLNVDGREVKPPLFAHRWRLGSLPDKNKKGSFFSWRVNLDGSDAAACRLPKSDPVFQDAAAFYERVRKGKVKAVHDAAEPAGSDDNVPF